MTLHDYRNDPEQMRLRGLIEAYQHSRVEWATAHDAAQKRNWRTFTGKHLEQLWEFLADDLMRRARRWRRGYPADDIEPLAMNMFYSIMLKLPQLQIDPTKNTRSLLLKIAWFGLIDEHRAAQAANGVRPTRETEREWRPESGWPEAEMWLRHEQVHAAPAAELLDQLPDQQSYDAEERLVHQLDRDALLREVWQYWSSALPPDTLQIMTLRYESEPPTSFSDIARQLGPGWEEATVRMRHHRAIKETQGYLLRRGLLTSSSAT